MKYHYPNRTQIFELIKIENDVYFFKCGHKVMGSVFDDLINAKTGVANWETPKLKL